MRVRILGIALLAVVGLMGIIAFSAGCGGLSDNAAASVNGTIITKDEVAGEISIMRMSMGAMIPAEDAGDIYTNFVRETTEKLVFYELIRQEAEKKGMTVTNSEIEQRLQELADDSFLGEVSKLREEYTRKGFTEEDLRTEVTRALRQEKLAESIGREIEVTDEDAQSYYDRNRIQYDQPERRQVRQIVTDNEAAALDAVKRARAGESFITLVEELSTDSQSSQKKGALGMVTRDQLPPELDSVVFNMQAGAISDPVKLGSQWYVFSLENLMPANLRTFEQASDEIKRHYGAQKFSERWKKYGEDVRADASIEYATDYDPALKADLEAPAEN